MMHSGVESFAKQCLSGLEKACLNVSNRSIGANRMEGAEIGVKGKPYR